MKVEQFFAKTGGDYNDLLRAYKTPERINNYFSYFIEDHTYDELCMNVKNREFDLAYNSAHTLKGISLNLRFQNLAVTLQSLMLELKEQNIEKIDLYMEIIKKQYRTVVEYIKQDTQ